ncbi:hypothetical protein EMIHUDRAFT_432922, partial [Emiliania huxleyi CCMP1516]|uniref:Uncharacterized protein n=2 Tax=Emiliania huxleyi TaxID=2903 RepID=A0A0D3IED2_EMIH1
MARGRVALAPGCSLSAWMRLSKGDLTGGVGRCDEDDEEAWPTWSLADVASHNSPEDSWVAVRGKVACTLHGQPHAHTHTHTHTHARDVLTRFSTQLDATALFQKHHAWVNVEMLFACCVGTLAKPVVTNGQGRRVKWDEQGIQAHDAQRGVMFGTMKIEQLDTPFLYLDEDGGGECVAIHPAYLPSHLPGAKQTEALRPHKMEVDELQHALGLD